jgi:hypothetical protein
MILEADSLGIVRYVPEEGFDSLAYYSPARTPGATLFTIDRFNRPIVQSNGEFHRLSALGDFWSVIVPPIPADSVRSLLYIDHRTQFLADRKSIWRTVDGGRSWDRTILSGGNLLSLSIASAIPLRPVDGDEVTQIVAVTDRELWSSYDFGLHWSETTGDLPTTDPITSYAYDPYTGLHLVALDRAGIYWSERQRASEVVTTGSPRFSEVMVDVNGVVHFVLDPGLVPTSVRAYDLAGRAIPGEVTIVSESVGGGGASQVRWTASASTSGLIFFDIEGETSQVTSHATIKVILP